LALVCILQYLLSHSFIACFASSQSNDSYTLSTNFALLVLYLSRNAIAFSLESIKLGFDSTLLPTCALINGFLTFGDIFLLSVACFSGVFLATGSFGASVVDCAKGAVVFVGSAFQGWTVGFFTFSIHVSNISGVLGHFTLGGCATCGNPHGAITVAFGAGSAFTPVGTLLSGLSSILLSLPTLLVGALLLIGVGLVASGCLL
jgi:hypothetical protein